MRVFDVLVVGVAVTVLVLSGCGNRADRDPWQDGLLLVEQIRGEPAETSEGLEVYCRTLVEMLKSRVVMERTVKRVEGLRPDIAMPEVKSALEAKTLVVEPSWIEGTAMIRVEVAYRGGQDLAGQFCDALMYELVKLVGETQSSDAEDQVTRLTGQIHRLEMQVEVAEAALKEAKRGATDGGEEAQMTLDKAEKRYAEATGLYAQLGGRIRTLDIGRNLEDGWSRVSILQSPGK